MKQLGIFDSLNRSPNYNMVHWIGVCREWGMSQCSSATLVDYLYYLLDRMGQIKCLTDVLYDMLMCCHTVSFPEELWSPGVVQYMSKQIVVTKFCILTECTESFQVPLTDNSNLRHSTIQYVSWLEAHHKIHKNNHDAITL